MKRTPDARATTRSIDKFRSGRVRLWTIQPHWVWERLNEQNTLTSDPTTDESFPDMREAYDWMREQMHRRLPTYEGRYPWWAYEHKPSLRWYEHSDPERMVRLELALPPECVLLSAYGAWHCVLNSWYLPQSVEEEEYTREDDAWEEELKQHGLDPYMDHRLPEPWRSRLLVSWERIFDVDDLRETNTTQACFEELKLEDVLKVTFFTPRPPYRSDRNKRKPE